MQRRFCRLILMRTIINLILLNTTRSMKAIRIILLAAASIGLMTLGACKSKNAGYQNTPAVAPGSYIDSGK